MINRVTIRIGIAQELQDAGVIVPPIVGDFCAFSVSCNKPAKSIIITVRGLYEINNSKILYLYNCGEHELLINKICKLHPKTPIILYDVQHLILFCEKETTLVILSVDD